MKRIIAINLFILSLTIILFPKNHTTGGANAAESYAELYVYDVQIENNVSKVVTTMTVMAPNEADALKNVSLNGWTVIRATRRIIPDNASEPIPAPKQTDDLSLDTVILEIPKKVQLDNPLIEDDKNANRPKSPNNTPNNDEVMVGFDGNGNRVMDNLNLLPTSPELELKMTLFYNLGVVTPMLNQKVLAALENLPKDARYVIFGNADIVRVGKNASYDTNYELSYLRADYIKKMMERKGFNADKIRVIGLGTRYPLVESKTGHVKNRRVEIYGFRS